MEDISFAQKPPMACHPVSLAGQEFRVTRPIGFSVCVPEGDTPDQEGVPYAELSLESVSIQPVLGYMSSLRELDCITSFSMLFGPFSSSFFLPICPHSLTTASVTYLGCASQFSQPSESGRERLKYGDP